MITREEYNKALDIVEAYHKQMYILGIKSEKNLTKIENWNKLSLCSNRLYNILNDSNRKEYDNPKYKLKYIEAIFKKEFKRQRNAGQATWSEFKELRGY